MSDKNHRGSRERTTKSTIERRPIESETLSAVGRIVISASDLDDMLSLLMFRFGRMPSLEDGFIILGRLAVSEKVKRLSRLIQRRATAEFRRAFESDLAPMRKIIFYRNVFAHGVYQGVDRKDGALVFALTAHDLWQDDFTPGHESIGFVPAQITDFATATEGFVTARERNWKLKNWRATRYERHLRLQQPGQRPRRD